MTIEKGTIAEIIALFNFVITENIGTPGLHHLANQWKEAQLFVSKVRHLYTFYDNPEYYILEDSEAFTLTMLFPLAMCNYKSAT